MSCQPPPWTRRNASPKQQAGPVRATLPITLMRQSPSKNKSNSPKKHSDPGKIEVETGERPTLFLGPRGEKSKTLNLRSQPQQYHIRRTSSLDALFLASNCQSETIFLGCFMVDKATQTPDEWFEEEFQGTQWKTMATGSEQFEVKYIRRKLQRTNQNSRPGGVLLCSQRQSPIHGDHSAVSSLDSGNLNISHTGAFGVMHKSVLPTVHVTRPIVPFTHGPKPRLQSSLEGLNQEIEKIVLRDSSGGEIDESRSRVFEPVPDGHRAPIAQLFHSIKSTRGYESRSSSSSSSSAANRSHSTSPVIPALSTSSENSISPSKDDTDCTNRLGSSPQINKFLAREPPDGCEKVKILDDIRRAPGLDFTSENSLSRPEFSSVLLPSQSSAFYPLYKIEKKSPLYNSYNVHPPSANAPAYNK